MPSFACPRCSNVVTVGAGQNPVCGKCGFGKAAGVVAQPAAWPQGAQNQYPQYAVAPQYGRTDGMSVAALVMGCLGWFSLPGAVMAILAIIFGIVGINHCKQNPSLKGRGMAIAGVVLGSIFTAFWLIALLFISLLFGEFMDY